MRNPAPGDVICMKSFEHDTPNLRVTFAVNPPRTPKKDKKVALFLLLGQGDANLDPTEGCVAGINIEKRLNDMGWYFFEKPPRKPRAKKVDKPA